MCWYEVFLFLFLFSGITSNPSFSDWPFFFEDTDFRCETLQAQARCWGYLHCGVCPLLQSCPASDVVTDQWYFRKPAAQASWHRDGLYLGMNQTFILHIKGVTDVSCCSPEEMGSWAVQTAKACCQIICWANNCLCLQSAMTPWLFIENRLEMSDNIRVSQTLISRAYHSQT